MLSDLKTLSYSYCSVVKVTKVDSRGEHLHTHIYTHSHIHLVVVLYTNNQEPGSAVNPTTNRTRQIHPNEENRYKRNMHSVMYNRTRKMTFILIYPSKNLFFF